MRLYHRTTAAAAAAILGSGFVDREAYQGGAGRATTLRGLGLRRAARRGRATATLLVVTLRVPPASLAACTSWSKRGGRTARGASQRAVLNQAASIAIVADGQRRPPARRRVGRTAATRCPAAHSS